MYPGRRQRSLRSHCLALGFDRDVASRLSSVKPPYSAVRCVTSSVAITSGASGRRNTTTTVRVTVGVQNRFTFAYCQVDINNKPARHHLSSTPFRLQHCDDIVWRCTTCSRIAFNASRRPPGPRQAATCGPGCQGAGGNRREPHRRTGDRQSASGRPVPSSGDIRRTWRSCRGTSMP